MFPEAPDEPRHIMTCENGRRGKKPNNLLAGALSFVLVLALGQGCSKDEPKPSGTSWGVGGSGAGGAAGTGGTTSHGGSGGSAGADAGGSAGKGGSSGGSAGNAGGMAGSAGAIEDASAEDAIDWDTYTKEGAVPDDQAAPTAPCATAISANKTKGLTAGGVTPTGFANAFNAFNSAHGPLLIVFSGLDQVADDSRTAKFGPIVPSGNVFDFASPPAVTSLSATADRHLIVPYTLADFALRFDDGATQVDVPAVAVEMLGQLDGVCAVLTVEKLAITIPVTSGGIAFAGSTVGALMGPPTTSWGSGSDNGWKLELSGMAPQVTYSGSKEAGP